MGVPSQCRGQGWQRSHFLLCLYWVILDSSPSKGKRWEKAWAGLPGLKSSAASTFWRKPLWQPMLHLFIHSLMELSAGAKALHDWSHLVALRSANAPKRHLMITTTEGYRQSTSVGQHLSMPLFQYWKDFSSAQSSNFSQTGSIWNRHIPICTSTMMEMLWNFRPHEKEYERVFWKTSHNSHTSLHKFNEEKRTAVLNRSDLNLLISHIFSVTGWPTLTSNSLAGVLLPREHSKTKQKKHADVAKGMRQISSSKHKEAKKTGQASPNEITHLINAELKGHFFFTHSSNACTQFENTCSVIPPASIPSAHEFPNQSLLDF